MATEWFVVASNPKLLAVCGILAQPSTPTDMANPTAAIKRPERATRICTTSPRGEVCDRTRTSFLDGRLGT